MKNEDSTCDSCGVAALDLSVIRISGGDRARFLHNFCTADIKKLQANQCCEAFFLNSKGKTICHGIVVCREIDFVIVSTAKSSQVLIDALDMFLLSDDVQMSDDSKLWRSTFVFGPTCEAVLAECEMAVPASGAVVSSGFGFSIEAELAGSGLLILEPKEGNTDAKNSLIAKGATEYSLEQLHVERVANRTPWCESEVTDRCLPQEFRRDEKAISFTKGCYLGQETVARLDALGHVNRYFVGFEILEGEVAVGDELRSDGKKLGVVTSLAETSSGKKIGLGFLRVEHATPDNEIAFESSKLRVIA